MKYLAHFEKSLDSKIISIYDVIKGLNGERPQDWEERTYYSLWYNTPMIAKVNSLKQKPHFAFKKGFGGNENSGGGESLEHQLSKKIITDLKSLRIKIGDIEDSLSFSEMIIEQPFEGGKYQADLYCRIANENKFNFPVDSMIVIELHCTNKVKKSKRKFYRDKNITAIEIDIWEKIRYDDSIEELQRQLIGYFKKTRFAKRLHDPNWQRLVQEKEKQKAFRWQKEIDAKREKILNQRKEVVGLQKERAIESISIRQDMSLNYSNSIKPQSESNFKKKRSLWSWVLNIIRK